jgi:ribosome-binding factor A
MVKTQRTQRVGDLIKREIADIIDRKLKDPRIGLVTVTDVSVTADLRYARVYFTVLGAENERHRAQTGLESARSFIQGEIGRRIRLKFTPELSFHFDKSLQRGFHIDKILKELKTKHDEKPEGGDSGS